MYGFFQHNTYYRFRIDSLLGSRHRCLFRRIHHGNGICQRWDYSLLWHGQLHAYGGYLHVHGDGQ